MVGPAGQIMIRVGGAAVGVTGVGGVAAGASTVILATGTAVAIGMAGYGAYRWMTADLDGREQPQHIAPQPQQVPVVVRSMRNLRDLRDRFRPSR